MVSRLTAIDRGCSQVTCVSSPPPSVSRMGRRCGLANVLEDVNQEELRRLCPQAASQQNPLLNGSTDDESYSSRRVYFMNIVNSPRYRHRRNALVESTGLSESIRGISPVCPHMEHHTDTVS